MRAICALLSIRASSSVLVGFLGRPSVDDGTRDVDYVPTETRRSMSSTAEKRVRKPSARALEARQQSEESVV